MVALSASALGASRATAARQGVLQRAGIPFNVLLARGRTEPAIAADPRNRLRLVVTANPDYYHVQPNEPLNGTFNSFDGGATWSDGSAPPYLIYNEIADPSVVSAASGLTYYLYMGESPAYCGEQGNVALLLARSADGGHTFAPPSVVDINPSDDKPFLAVRTIGGHDLVYATFTRWREQERQILFTRSSDGGYTFSTPRIIQRSRGVEFGALPVIAPDGHVYAVWAHYQHSDYNHPLQASILVRASSDGGQTFGPIRTIASFAGLPQLLMPGSIRLFTLPTAATDDSGALYVAWVRARAIAHPHYKGQMEADVMLSRSRDGARTWTVPTIVSDSPSGDRFMPALTASGRGEVQVAFYDRRRDGVRFALYGVSVHDLGERLRLWPNRRISETWSSPYTLHYIVPGSTCVAGGRFMGDYIGTATSSDGALNVAWADTALHKPNETDLWFARASAQFMRAGQPRLVPW